MPRPREPLIERNHAVRVALEMIDENGLAAFSLEKLSKRLGVRGPSLYHHFADRADLLARVAGVILREVPDTFADPDMPWDEQLLCATIELRHAVLRHPNAGPVLLEHFPRELVLPIYDRAVARLEAAEVPARFHVLLIDGLEKLALGFGLSRAASQVKHGVAFPEFAADEYPNLARALDSSEFEEETLFEATARALIEGVKLRIDAEPAPSRRDRRGRVRSRVPG